MSTRPCKNIEGPEVKRCESTPLVPLLFSKAETKILADVLVRLKILVNRNDAGSLIFNPR